MDVYTAVNSSETKVIIHTKFRGVLSLPLLLPLVSPLFWNNRLAVQERSYSSVVTDICFLKFIFSWLLPGTFLAGSYILYMNFLLDIEWIE